MRSTSQLAVGIDLGTTFSMASWIDEKGTPMSLPNAEGDKLTPSVLLFDGNDVIVGKEAIKAMSTDMDAVADCPKRDIGQRMYHKTLCNRHYPPEALQGWILNKLREDAESQVGTIKKVVITVPAYFDEVKRKATQDAGYIAGMDVIDIINEPTAAAVAFGYQKGLFSKTGEARVPNNVLVYDLGGGTFDVTVMQIKGDQFVTLATDGDVKLGGRDWDQRLVDSIAEEFIRSVGVDPRDDSNTLGRLWRECEDAKRTLSARAKTTINCEFKGHAVRLEVTRDGFQEMTQDLLDRTAFTTTQTLKAAGKTWDEIDRVILVGGSTRMPSVPAMLEKLTGQRPDNSVSPDEAVSHGAALRAHFLIAKHEGQTPTFAIRNVNSHSLGVVGVETETNTARTGVVIPRNTPIPLTAKRIFKLSKQGQKSILVQVVEGENSNPEDCVEICKCVIKDLPDDLPEGKKIEVRFKYQEDGRLTIEAFVEGTDISLTHEMVRDNSLSEEQLEAWQAFVCS